MMADILSSIDKLSIKKEPMHHHDDIIDSSNANEVQITIMYEAVRNTYCINRWGSIKIREM